MEEWKKVSENITKADGWQKIVTRKFVLPDGKEDDFEIKKEKDCVCALAITKDNKIILGKQFRPGPEKVLFELPGGAVEENERPEETMKRELLEETGYTGEIRYAHSLFDCGYSTRVIHCFVATNCKKVQDQKLDATEFIEVVEMPFKDFKQNILDKGQLTDTDVAYVGMDFLGLLPE